VVAAELVRDILGVELLGARRGADQVGEDDSDDLSLAAALRQRRVYYGPVLAPFTGGPSIGSFSARKASWSR